MILGYVHCTVYTHRCLKNEELSPIVTQKQLPSWIRQHMTWSWCHNDTWSWSWRHGWMTWDQDWATPKIFSICEFFVFLQFSIIHCLRLWSVPTCLYIDTLFFLCRDIKTFNGNFVHKVIIYHDYLCRLSRACPCCPWRPPPPSTWSTTDSPTTAWSGARGATSPSPPPTERYVADLVAMLGVLLLTRAPTLWFADLQATIFVFICMFLLHSEKRIFV